jgi:hypothetical protein
VPPVPKQAPALAVSICLAVLCAGGCFKTGTSPPAPQSDPATEFRLAVQKRLCPFEAQIAGLTRDVRTAVLDPAPVSPDRTRRGLRRLGKLLPRFDAYYTAIYREARTITAPEPLQVPWRRRVAMYGRYRDGPATQSSCCGKAARQQASTT